MPRCIIHTCLSSYEQLHLTTTGSTRILFVSRGASVHFSGAKRKCKTLTTPCVFFFPQPNNNSFMSGGTELSGSTRGSNGMQLQSTDLAELRRRLAQQPEPERTSTTLFNNGLSSIQISKVTNGQVGGSHPGNLIPENGINLKGTSVTLTKIRSQPVAVQPQPAAPEPQQQQHQEEPKAANGKSRKKKKRGNGVRQCGDDWNLVGETAH